MGVSKDKHKYTHTLTYHSKNVERQRQIKILKAAIEKQLLMYNKLTVR